MGTPAAWACCGGVAADKNLVLGFLIIVAALGPPTRVRTANLLTPIFL